MSNYMRSTEECEQMNAIYDALNALMPSMAQIMALYNEARDIALNPAESRENQRHAALFMHQLREHVRRRATT